MRIRNRFRWLAACTSLLALTCATNASAFITGSFSAVVEYVNEATGRYMLLKNGSTLLDDGGDGGRWTRTGHVFSVYESFSGSSEAPVCRFYSAASNAHFFTPYPAECEALKRPGSGWVFEGNEFGSQLPSAAGCSFGLVAVRRLSDRGPDHRYSADPPTIARMLARGWVDEGIGFCAFGTYLAPEKHFDPINAVGLPRPIGECTAKAGPCVAVAQLPAMPTLVSPWLDRSRGNTPNPGYPIDIRSVMGTVERDIYTSLPAGASESDVLRHSFYFNRGGFHIVGADRREGPYASMSLMQQLPGVAGSSQDERVFPWRNGRERELIIASSLSVRSVTRANTSSHAYGMPMIQFADRASGRSFYVTLQAFGTLPAGDFVGADYSTGWAIVSTSFRANPLFGRRLSGEFVLCDPTSTAECLPATTFTFALSKADFQKVVGLARGIDPALSTDPGNYFVASFRQHNETYLDATLGILTYRLILEIWPYVQ